MNSSNIDFSGVNLYEDFPIITLKVNQGKTTFAITELKEVIESKAQRQIEKVILLTPYKRTKQQLLADDRFIGKVAELDNALNKKVVLVATYAGISHALQEQKVNMRDTLIIFDELPTFIEFSSYQPQLAYLLEFILDKESFRSCVCVGMTGTPQLLFDYANKCGLPFEFKDITPHKELNITAKNGVWINCGSALTYAKYLIQNGVNGAKVIYVQSATLAIKISRLFTEAGYNSAFVISESNNTIDKQTKKPYNELMEQQIFDGLSIVEWLDDRSDIPPTLDILVINASARDGVNILDTKHRINEVIIQSENRMTIEQARARVRHDIEQLVIIYSKENEKHAMNGIDDIIQYFRNSDEDIITRNLKQMKRFEEIEQWKEARNNAILMGVPFTEPRPQALNNIAMRGSKGVFENPFILPLALSELDNFVFSNEYDIELNECVEYFRFGVRIHTFQEFKNSLKPLINNGDFSVISNASLAVQVNNADKINPHTIKVIMGLDYGETKSFTVAEMREFAGQFEPINNDYKKRSVPTLLKELAKYCEIKKYTPTINGKRKTAYKIKM